ncbi:tetratricopeptide repeat protein [Massilia sp. S19_KUP03_FR1]|uniref:tetratricopeptide repeat protein n=1 Tax=Massilia sp. S19_KUP03_FR1 TaxID=3025503 RepID=UPI002FCDB318
MSLINKMLQDLDARGAGGGVDPVLVKPVLRPTPKLVPRVALAVGLVALLVVAGWLGWRVQQKPQPSKGPMPLAAVPAGMVRVTPPQPVVSAPAVIAPATVVAAPPARVKVVKAEAPVRAPRRVAQPAEQTENIVTRSTAAAAPRGSEADYRRALADLQDGRVTDAIAALERALQTDPRHDAARQTLVSLLVEAGRREAAQRQLQLGLGLDPRQPAMAMLLARLQLEQGDAGAVDTLLRTLPYAQGNGDYQAFLAGVLQRQQRHGEAVVQYQAALAATPGNPIWLMGMGISLQAEKRLPQALAAFQQADASGALPPNLQGFVERKVQQLKQ